MCLYVKKDQEFKIAKNAIIVFKHGEVNKGVLRTCYQYASYKKDSLNPVVPVQVSVVPEDSDVNNKSYPDVVNAGYHSFVRLCDCSMDSESSTSASLFVIPTGTRYIEGVYSEVKNIVSEQIVYLGSVWNPFNWLKYFKYNK